MLPVVILAGGLATRMYPATARIPKSLLEICGKKFIFHQLSMLVRKGINDVVLCLGHLGNMVEDYIISEHFPIEINFSYDGDKLLGTGGAILKALQYVKSPFFVLYGDSYLDIDYCEVEEVYTKCGKQGLMTVYRNVGQWDKSNVVFKNGEILHYSKVNCVDGMDFIDYGLGVLTPRVFEGWALNNAFDLAEVYQELIKDGELHGFEVYERFYETGSPAGLADMERYLTERGW